MPQEPTDPRLDNPLVREAIRGWYKSLEAHDLEDVRAHLQGLGVLVILLAKLAPSTKTVFTETDEEFRRKLEAWKKAVAELLVIDLHGGTR